MTSNGSDVVNLRRAARCRGGCSHAYAPAQRNARAKICLVSVHHGMPWDRGRSCSHLHSADVQTDSRTCRSNTTKLHARLNQEITRTQRTRVWLSAIRMQQSMLPFIHHRLRNRATSSSHQAILRPVGKVPRIAPFRLGHSQTTRHPISTTSVGCLHKQGLCSACKFQTLLECY